eukprot:jgi/Chrzof1/14284/Cz08g31360.t1
MKTGLERTIISLARSSVCLAHQLAIWLSCGIGSSNQHRCIEGQQQPLVSYKRLWLLLGMPHLALKIFPANFSSSPQAPPGFKPPP